MLSKLKLITSTILKMIKFSKKIYNSEKVILEGQSGTSHHVHGTADSGRQRGRNLDMHLNKIRDESKLKREWMKMGLHGETKLSQGFKTSASSDP